ncbi:MAG: protein-glutamate methylesterase/protein-glutamine glutaminase [Spirochaetota bacterium]
MDKKIRVLVVDDSALVRRIITDALEKDPEIEVIGTANNGKTAVFKSFVLYPDVITMDIEMPIMNGLDALREIMETNAKPVIMLSSLTQHGAEATFKALEYGAVDFVPKPQAMLSMSVEEIASLLVSKVKAVAKSEINYRAKDLSHKVILKENMPRHLTTAEREAARPIPKEVKIAGHRSIVCIGTSTGGPSALMRVFQSFPGDFTLPVLVVQHMPEGFTKAFAERLNSFSALNVKEAEDGDKIEKGCAYIAPGHSHMVLEKRMGQDYVSLHKGEKVSGHRPSIDELFLSVNRYYSSEVIAVIMTGMGRDGASGITAIGKSGGYTIAQDESTSVVFGMNRVAIELGAIKNIVPLEEITKKIVEHI